MTEDSRIDIAILGRVLGGGGTLDDRHRVERFFERHPEFDVLTGAELPNGAKRDEILCRSTAEHDDARVRLARHLNVSADSLPFWGSPLVSSSTAPMRRTGEFRVPAMAKSGRGWLQLAGSAAIGAAVVVGLTMMSRMKSPGLSAEPTVYVTANGQRTNITLPDGSIAALSVGSRLEVPADYGERSRAVVLEGQALFTVPRSDRTAFSVTTGGTTTRVLGTSFMVRRYAVDTALIIAVRSGKVAVNSAVISADQQAEVNNRGVTTVHAARSGVFDFASGVLTLEEQPLSVAIAELNRWYNADIRVSDRRLAAHLIKGEFAAGSLDNLSALLSLMLDARVTRDGRVLTLSPRK